MTQLSNNTPVNTNPFINQNTNTSSDNSPPKSTLAGYMALLLAMLNNSDAVQNLVSNGLMPLSLMVTDQTQTYSQSWLLVMNNPSIPDGKGDPKPTTGDMQILAWDNANGADASTINADIANFNQHNTSYNAMTTFFSGISSGVNDTTSHTNDQVTFDYQEIQLCSLATQSNLATVLGS